MGETSSPESLRAIVQGRRIALGFSARALAAAVGVSHSYISQIERGIIKRPSLLVLKRLSSVLAGCSYRELLAAAGYGNIGPPEEDCAAERQRDLAAQLWEIAGELSRQAEGTAVRGFKAISLSCSVPASFGLATAEPEPQEECDTAFIHESRLRGDKSAFALKVRGDSMADAGILEGDIVVVSPQSQWRSGDICVVRLNGGEHSIKRVVSQGELIILQPCNSKYEPLAIPPDRQCDLHICGKVIHSERSFA